MTRRRKVFGGALALPRFLGMGALLAFATCQSEPHKVVVFHTSSLSPLLQTVSRRFEANNPDVAILAEAAGSLDTIGKVTDLGRACDLLAIADHRLIARLLMPERIQVGYEFLGNELVLAASERRLFEPLTRQPRRRKDWFELLIGGTHSYGVSDPDQDPAGYYTQLSWKLAELHYNRTALYRRLINGLDPRWVRPRSTELVDLLKNKTVDFAFLYKSVALQNGLDFVDFSGSSFTLGTHLCRVVRSGITPRGRRSCRLCHGSLRRPDSLRNLFGESGQSLGGTIPRLRAQYRGSIPLPRAWLPEYRYPRDSAFRVRQEIRGQLDIRSDICNKKPTPLWRIKIRLRQVRKTIWHA